MLLPDNGDLQGTATPEITRPKGSNATKQTITVVIAINGTLAPSSSTL